MGLYSRKPDPKEACFVLLERLGCLVSSLNSQAFRHAAHLVPKEHAGIAGLEMGTCACIRTSIADTGWRGATIESVLLRILISRHFIPKAL